MPDFDREALKPAVKGRRPPMPADVFARVSISYGDSRSARSWLRRLFWTPAKNRLGQTFAPEVRVSLTASPAPHPVEGQRPQTDASLHTFG